MVTDGPRGSARVTLADGSRTTLWTHEIQRDSIIGTTAAGDDVRAAAGDVRSFEVPRLNATRTATLVVFHASALVSLIALIVHVQPHYRGTF